MTKQKIGAMLLVSTTIALLIYSICISMQFQALKKENPNVSVADDTENNKKVETLYDELLDAKKQLQGSTSNNESTVKHAAEYFLETYYDNENSTEYEQLAKVKLLVSDEVYASLKPFGENETDPYNMQPDLFYKTWVSDLQSYYSYTNETESEVFIYCTMHVQTDSVNTASPFIFSATMNYINNQWVITAIHTNTTIRISY